MVEQEHEPSFRNPESAARQPGFRLVTRRRAPGPQAVSTRCGVFELFGVWWFQQQKTKPGSTSERQQLRVQGETVTVPFARPGQTDTGISSYRKTTSWTRLQRNGHRDGRSRSVVRPENMEGRGNEVVSG